MLWNLYKGGRSWAVTVVLAIGFTLTLATFLQMIDSGRRAELALVEQQSSQLRTALEERLENYSLLLRSLTGSVSGPVTRIYDTFGAISDPLIPLFPDIRGIAWSSLLDQAEIPAMEEEMRRAGLTDFMVDPLFDYPPAAPVGGDAQPYRSPLIVNVLVRPGGWRPDSSDLAVSSPPGRREVFRLACDSSMVVGSDVPRDDAGGEGGRNLLLVRAVGGQGRSGIESPGLLGGAGAPAGGENRQCTGVSGFIWVVADINLMLRDAVNRLRLEHAHVYLVDRSEESAARLVASSVDPESRRADLNWLTIASRTSEVVIRQAINFPGLRYELLVTKQTLVPMTWVSLRDADQGALAVLILGSILTLGFANYIRREVKAKRLLQIEGRARAAISRALRESEQRFRLALRHSKVSVFSQNADLRYIWMYNPQNSRPAEAHIGRTDAELFGADVAAAFDRVKQPVLLSGLGGRQEVQIVNNGSVQVYDLIVEPLRDDMGAVTGIICAAIDITEATEIREALAEAHAEAERANEAKSRFLAAASHDLRQPFQAIGLFHHILTQRLTEPRQLEVAIKLGEAVAAGNTLLSTLLDNSALEAGNVKPRPVTFALGSIIERLAGEIFDQAADKGLTLRHVKCSVDVHTDPVLLERMIRNLVVNALRYTRSGRILLGCRRVSSQELRVEVWDTGPGIANEQLESIFQDFYRGQNEMHKSDGGLGLGLSIVRRTAHLLGQRVEVRSILGRGTVFSITMSRMIDPAAGPVAEAGDDSVDGNRDMLNGIPATPASRGASISIGDPG